MFSKRIKSPLPITIASGGQAIFICPILRKQQKADTRTVYAVIVALLKVEVQQTGFLDQDSQWCLVFEP
ncbi:unnamed protein product [Arctogadus glacialis]